MIGGEELRVVPRPPVRIVLSLLSFELQGRCSPPTHTALARIHTDAAQRGGGWGPRLMVRLQFTRNTPPKLLLDYPDWWLPGRRARPSQCRAADAPAVDAMLHPLSRVRKRPSAAPRRPRLVPKRRLLRAGGRAALIPY